MASTAKTPKASAAVTIGPAVRELPLNLLKLHKQTITRAITREWVRDGYMEAMRAGAKLPALTAFYDGKTYWLADGHYRLDAGKRLGYKTMPVEVRSGTLRDASLWAAGANAEHGLLRTTADKRMAVDRLLHDREWRLWSDSEIGRRCRVSHSFVGQRRALLARRKLITSAASALWRDAPVARAYVSKSGTVSAMDTSKIVAANKARASARRESTPLMQHVRHFSRLIERHAKRLPGELLSEWAAIKALLDEAAGGNG